MGLQRSAAECNFSSLLRHEILRHASCVEKSCSLLLFHLDRQFGQVSIFVGHSIYSYEKDRNDVRRSYELFLLKVALCSSIETFENFNVSILLASIANCFEMKGSCGIVINSIANLILLT